LLFTQLKSVLDTRRVFSSQTFDSEKQQFRRKSCKQKWRIQDNLPKRHIFVQHIYIISRRITGFELVVTGTGGAASHVVNHRLRNEPVLIAIKSGPIPDIRVFQIGKMLLIKISDFLKNFSPVNR